MLQGGAVLAPTHRHWYLNGRSVQQNRERSKEMEHLIKERPGVVTRYVQKISSPFSHWWVSKVPHFLGIRGSPFCGDDVPQVQDFCIAQVACLEV